MKKILDTAILILMTFSWVNSQTIKDRTSTMTETKGKAFNQVVDFPTIKDSTKFITDLRQNFGLEVDESPFQKANEKITTYQKVKINGCAKDYYFIEYDYGDGCMAAYPWKYQILLTTEGHLVKIMTGQRFEFVTIFPNKNPFILLVIATAKGNGGHEFYKMSADTLENVYEGYYDYDVRTFDAHQDNTVYEPNELTLKIEDYNKDGDIAFVGKIVLIRGLTEYGVWYDEDTIDGKTITYSVDNPFKKIPIEYIYLYDKETGHFKAKENYVEKYEMYN